MSTVYWNMRKRCYDSSGSKYHRYGGRGIKVCARWLEPKRKGFANFWEDMGDKPTGMTLDRIDHNGDYSPSNCRWASWGEQANNRSNNHVVEMGGEKMTLQEWCRKTGLAHNTILMRVNKYGWDLEKALTTPVRKRG